MMDPARYQRIKQLFDAACAHPPAERAAYLEQACAGDAELCAEVEALLRVDASDAGDALDVAVARSCGEEALTPPRGPDRIGAFRILGVCGAGGMGTVYEAEQDDPHRRVAIKVIQRTSARPEVLRRFRREAAILGRLQHPGIARILEAGEFEQDGVTRPYFAMEFVEGPSVLDYARQHQLDSPARQALFIRICDAVHHAHQQGVVHRDLKPDNILVVEPTGTPASALDGGCQPKVLDFGVARLIDAGAPPTMATGDGQMLGSLPYMSPEQASGAAGAVDARSDVYALGVLLFELLTGRLPYDVRGRPLVDAVRVIQLSEPTRLGSVDVALRGDVETIVGKCLEKDPKRRYQSALALADDLRRHLARLPIAARPPSTWYQLQMFARRNRGLVGGAAAALGALFVGLVIAVLFAVRAAKNERRALREAYRARIAAAAALVEGDPLAAREALDSVAEARRGWEWRHLDSRLARHRSEFGEVAVDTPVVPVDGGARVLAGRDGRRVCLWDVDSGAAVATWTAPADVATWGIAPDGSRIAAGLVDGRVLVAARRPESAWGEWLRCASPPVQLEFAADGKRLAVLERRALHVGDPQRGWREIEVAKSGVLPRVALDPRHSRLALAGGSARTMYDADTLEVLARRPDPDSPAAIAFAPNGDELVVGTVQRRVHRCDPETLATRTTLVGHTRSTRRVVVGQDGTLLTTADDGTLRLWSREGMCEAVLSSPGVCGAAFMAPGRIVSAGAGRLRVWDLDDAGRRVLHDHRGYVYDVAFSADGARLASYAPFEPRELLVWEAWTGRLLARHPGLAGRPHAAFRFDGAGNLIYGSGESLFVQPWFAPGARPAPPASGLAQTWSVRGKGLTTLSARAPWPDPELPRSYRTEYGARAGNVGERLFVDGEPVELEHRSDAAPPSPGPHPRLLVGELGLDRVSMDGWMTDLIVYGGWLAAADAAAVEDYLAGRRRGEGGALPAVASATLLAHFRADADSVRTAATGAPAPVLAWAARNDPGLVLRPLGWPMDAIRFEADGATTPERVVFANKHQDKRWLEAAFPAARGEERITVFWSGCHSGDWYGGSSTAYALRTLPMWPDPPRDASGGSRTAPGLRRGGVCRSRSADGRLVALGPLQWPRPAQLRDAATGDLLAEYGAGPNAVYHGVALHPDGHLLAGAGADGRLEVWNTETHALHASVDAHVGEVYSVDWSPDGSRIVTGGNDNSIRIWDAETLDKLLELRGHDLYVKAVAFSPDGTMLASASGDGTVRLWDTVPAAERYRQLLETRRLEAEVRPQVARWLAQHRDPLAAAEAIRQTFAGDPARMQAAFTALAAAGH